jgi:hypothetical protein
MPFPVFCFALLSVAFSFTYCCFINYTTKVTFFADNTKQKVLKKIIKFLTLLLLFSRTLFVTLHCSREQTKHLNIKNFRIMAKTISNSELVETIKEQGFATEKQILLLKNRMNRNKENEQEISDLTADIMPIKLTEEQAEKGREWLLRKNLKNNGTFRKNATLSENEISVLKDTQTAAYLSDFCDFGNRYVTNNVPIYRYENENDAFDYYVQGGDAQLY